MLFLISWFLMKPPDLGLHLFQQVIKFNKFQKVKSAVHLFGQIWYKKWKIKKFIKYILLLKKELRYLYDQHSFEMCNKLVRLDVYSLM